MLSDLQECWYGQSDLISASPINKVKNKTNAIVPAPDQPWKLVLPVIDCCPEGDPNCASPKPSPCTKVVGSVEINVLWITVNNPEYYPIKMGDWTCDSTISTTGDPYTDPACWNDFKNTFNLQDAEDSPAGFDQKSMYFKPECNPAAMRGNTGGSNYGILAKIPKLVNPHYFQ